jgi:hypothetical protein
MSREAFVPIPPPDRHVPKAIGIDRAQIGLVIVEADLITNFENFGLFSGHEVSHITELYENYKRADHCSQVSEAPSAWK